MARKAGRGEPIITDENLSDYLKEFDPPIRGTTEIAEHFDVSRPGALNRLHTMEERGVVRRVEVGQSFGWLLEDWTGARVSIPFIGHWGIGSAEGRSTASSWISLPTRGPQNGGSASYSALVGFLNGLAVNTARLAYFLFLVVVIVTVAGWYGYSIPTAALERTHLEMVLFVFIVFHLVSASLFVRYIENSKGERE